jgi:hypothetical protein
MSISDQQSLVPCPNEPAKSPAPSQTGRFSFGGDAIMDRYAEDETQEAIR